MPMQKVEPAAEEVPAANKHRTCKVSERFDQRRSSAARKPMEMGSMCGSYYLPQSIAVLLEAGLYSYAIHRTISIFFDERDIGPTLHLFLSIFAVCTCSFLAIMVMADFSFFPFKTRREKVLTHITLQFFALFFLILGGLPAVYTKVQKYKPHITTSHDKLGLFTILLMCGQVVLGMVTYHPQYVKKFCRPRVMKTVHTFVGLLTALFQYISTVTGVCTPWFAEDREESPGFAYDYRPVVLMIFIITVLYVCCNIFAIQTLLRRIRRLRSQTYVRRVIYVPKNEERSSDDTDMDGVD